MVRWDFPAVKVKVEVPGAPASELKEYRGLYHFWAEAHQQGVSI